MKLKTIEAASTRSQAARPEVASPEPEMPTAAEAARAAGERACPTRADGAIPLFQHRVTLSQCQSKQRGMYHKCFSCAHANANR
ncbi:hypothetical protein [Planctomycetes bacterium Poly30]